MAVIRISLVQIKTLAPSPSLYIPNMQSNTEEPGRSNMESLRLMCDKQITMAQQRMDSFTGSFRRSLDFLKAQAQETVQNQAKLAKFKADLREEEDEFVKVLALKTRKEAEHMATMDSISAAKARTEELRRTLHVQRARRDEYARIISQQSLALISYEEKASQNIERHTETQEAITWYNQVLGFQIEGGHGVKFTFTNINSRNPQEEYSFTIRHANDTYTLLDCDLHLDDIKELIQELNSTNGLFRFVRIMREKFQEAAAHGLLAKSRTFPQESATVSVSAPALSVSTDRSTSPAEKREHRILCESNRQLKKVNHGRGVTSPGSASSIRKSPRFKVVK